MPSKAGIIDLDAAARLALVRKTLKLNQIEVAKPAGITLGQLSHMEVGRRPLSFEIIKALYLTFRINPAYILNGEAPMIMNKAAKNNYDDLAAEIEVLKARLDKISGS